MTNAANLEISVRSTGVDRATNELDRLARTGGQAERATGSFTSSIGGMVTKAAVAAGAIVGITMSIQELVSVTREFEKLKAGLQTATGSAENAEAAFEALQDFAKNTPYDLQQVTESFTKLVNYGLTPSERALASYGNTSSALGKDMMQMIEAVADATTGEFERLKEFGIKAKSEGDNVSLTFRGVTTTVKNSSEEIENYLIQLGENNFSDAMANRMQTLDGALSNLGDSWEQLVYNVSNLGVGDVITDAVRGAIAILDELNAMLESGEMEGYLDAIGTAWEGWGKDIHTTIDVLMQWMNGVWKDHGDKVMGVVNFMIDAFRNFPANVRAVIQIAVTEIAAMVDKARAYGSALAEYLNPMGKATGEVTAELNARIAAIEGGKSASIDAILAERNATVQAVSDKIAAAKAERAEWEKTQAAKAGQGDRLARFKIGGDGKPGGDGKADKEAERKAKRDAERAKQEFEQLVTSLRTEEEAVEASYKKRTEIITKNTQEGSDLRVDLMRRSTEKYNEEMQKLRDTGELAQITEQLRTEEERIEESYQRRLDIIRRNTEEESVLRADLEARAKEQYEKDKEDSRNRKAAEIEAIRQDLLTEEEAMRESYEKRKQIILESTEITEAERLDLMTRLEQAYTERQRQLELQRNQQVLQGASQLFGGLAEAAATFGSKQSGLYKALFAVSKAFAIADAVIKIQQGIAAAAATPWPANIAAMASVAAATASIISTIQSVTFSPPKVSGAYDTGGMIPAGSYGLVGEIGPELVKGPAVVTGRKQTAGKLGNNGAAPVVNVHNYAGVDVAVQQRQGPSGPELELIIEQAAARAERNIANGISRGDGVVSRSLEGSFQQLRRGRG